MQLLIASALVFGAAASVLVRSGPPIARVAAVWTLLLLAWVVLVPPGVAVSEVPPQLAVACSGAVAPGSELAGALRAAGAVAVVDDAGSLPAALARAALRAGPRTAELWALWNAPLPSAPPWSAPPVAGAIASTAAPLPWPPDALQLTALGPARADRPLRLEAGVAAANEAVTATVRLVPAGNAKVAVERAVELPPRGATAVDLPPLAAGSVQAVVTAQVQGHRLERRGAFDVAPPSPVLVLSPGGAVAAALQTQGMAVVEAEALPADLSPLAAVVLGVHLPASEQQRLLAALDDGLGVFAFGDGLQRAGEPLRAVLPVRVVGRNTAGDAGGGDGGGDGGGAASPAPSPPSPAEPGAAPPESPPAAPPPNRPPPESPPPTGRTEPDRVPDPGGPVEVDRHAIAMVLVVDRSGSMGERIATGATKMSFVKTSAQRTADALDQGDTIGLVTFGNEGQARVELPLTDATERDAVRRGIAALAHAPEDTRLLSGLRQAFAMLQPSRAAVRHVVVLTDGEVHDLELPLRSVAHQMRTAGITVSIVSIVDAQVDPEFLGRADRVAKEGGGTFLPVRDPTVVPQLVSAEVVRALDRVGRQPRGGGSGAGPGNAGDGAGDQPPAPSPDPDRPDTPPQPPSPPPAAAATDAGDQELVVRAVAESPLLQPVDAPWPPLRRMADVTATIDAHVLLVGGARGLPVLGYANRGLGRVGVFAADLDGSDAAAFRQSPAFPARLAQWIAAVAPPLPVPAGDLLQATEVTPPAPTPAEVELLHALGAGPIAAVAALSPPGPRTVYLHRSQVPSWAFAALWALVLLAAIEWWAARR